MHFITGWMDINCHKRQLPIKLNKFSQIMGIYLFNDAKHFAFITKKRKQDWSMEKCQIYLASTVNATKVVQDKLVLFDANNEKESNLSRIQCYELRKILPSHNEQYLLITSTSEHSNSVCVVEVLQETQNDKLKLKFISRFSFKKPIASLAWLFDQNQYKCISHLNFDAKGFFDRIICIHKDNTALEQKCAKQTDLCESLEHKYMSRPLPHCRSSFSLLKMAPNLEISQQWKDGETVIFSLDDEFTNVMTFDQYYHLSTAKRKSIAHQFDYPSYAEAKPYSIQGTQLNVHNDYNTVCVASTTCQKTTFFVVKSRAAHCHDIPQLTLYFIIDIFFEHDKIDLEKNGEKWHGCLYGARWQLGSQEFIQKMIACCPQYFKHTFNQIEKEDPRNCDNTRYCIEGMELSPNDKILAISARFQYNTKETVLVDEHGKIFVNTQDYPTEFYSLWEGIVLLEAISLQPMYMFGLPPVASIVDLKWSDDHHLWILEDLDYSDEGTTKYQVRCVKLMRDDEKSAICKLLSDKFVGDLHVLANLILEFVGNAFFSHDCKVDVGFFAKTWWSVGSNNTIITVDQDEKFQYYTLGVKM